MRLRLQASRFQIIPPSEVLVEPVEAGQAARVLLVDDDQRLLRVLSDMMRSGGHAVATASSGEEQVIAKPISADALLEQLARLRRADAPSS